MEKQREQPKLLVYEEHDAFFERDLYEKGVTERWIKDGMVYNNVFNTVQRYGTLLDALGYQVAYGYVRVAPSVYKRSCFFVREDKIIDTSIQFYAEREESYYVVFSRQDVRDYVLSVLAAEGELMLEKGLEEQEQTMIHYANKNDITLLGRGGGRFER